MNNTLISLMTTVFIIVIAQIGNSQNGTLEATQGVIVGNNSGAADGTIRYTGADFEGRKSGNWVTLTANGGASMWDQNGSMIYYDTDNVGVGTNNPQTEFHIEGSNEILRLSGISPWIGFRETGES